MEGTIVLAIATTSLIVHLICAGQIAWQKWKYQKEDNIVYSIQLPKKSFQNDSLSNGNDVNQHGPSTNTKRYNPILFQFENVIYVAIILGLHLAIITLPKMYTNHVSDYVKLCFVPMMVNFFMPFMFYMRNAKARSFVVSCFTNR